MEIRLKERSPGNDGLKLLHGRAINSVFKKVTMMKRQQILLFLTWGILVLKDSTQCFPNSVFSHNGPANVNVGKKDKSKHRILFSKTRELNVKVQ